MSHKSTASEGAVVPYQNVRRMWDETRGTRHVRRYHGQMRRPSAGHAVDEIADIANRGSTTFLRTKTTLTALGLQDGYATAAAAFLAAADVTPDCVDWWQRTERRFRPPPQCGLIEGTPEERCALYDKKISRQSRKPYDVEYSKPGYAFTGIACLALSEAIQSPEAEVIKGGINCSTVTIRLTPVQEGEWACRIMVCGKPCTTEPSAETGRAGAYGSERRFRPPSQCRLVEGTPEERDALQQKTVFLQTREPYDYEYSKPGYTFTEISCLPDSAEIQSPEAEVIKGGINCSTVTIRLTPVEEGESACRIMVCGKPCTTGASAGVSEQSGRAGASGSAALAGAAAAVSDSPAPAAAVSDSPAPAAAVSDSAPPAAPVTDSPAPAAAVSDSPAPATAVSDSAAPAAAVTDSAAPAAAVYDSPAPAAAVTDSAAPAAAVYDSAAPAAAVYDSSAPAAPVTDSPAPTAAVSDSPAPVAAVSDSAPPVAPVTDSPAPAAVVSDSASPAAAGSDSAAPAAAVSDSAPPAAPVTDSPAPAAAVTDSAAPAAAVSDSPAPAAPVSDSPAPAAAVSDSPAPAAAVSDSAAPAAAVYDSPAPAAAVSDPALPATAVYVALVLVICLVVFEWCL